MEIVIRSQRVIRLNRLKSKALKTVTRRETSKKKIFIISIIAPWLFLLNFL